VTKCSIYFLTLKEFQSTPPQGGDFDNYVYYMPDEYFNPHHRKVVTQARFEKMQAIPISIHTTARW